MTSRISTTVPRSPSAPETAGAAGAAAVETAVPTLRVMRLQRPELHQPLAGTLTGHSLLQSALCLPDSLGVFVGETFTAYLGILNSSKTLAIRRLTVSAQLQSPSQRWQLPSHLDPNNNTTGVNVEPGAGTDAIVAHDIEEGGPHILRVEVGYVTSDGGTKTFRKFYRFQVVSPLTLKENVVRDGDSTCYVSLAVEFDEDDASSPTKAETLVIAEVDLTPSEGLSAERVGGVGPFKKKESSRLSSVDLLDESGLMTRGSCFRYLFAVKATSKDAQLRGIGAGDVLGRAVVTWRKAMGETGRITSSPIICPSVQSELAAGIVTSSNFVVHRSGLSVDVAAAAATRSARGPIDAIDLSKQLPVTIEPIDPPAKATLFVPFEVQFLVVNHSSNVMTLQVQFRLERMMGLVICGSSFKTVGDVPPNGGSAVTAMRFLPNAAGFLRVDGCVAVDLVSGRDVLQPPLFQVFVEQDTVGQ